MSQSFSLRWLIDFTKAGFTWVAKNPLLIVLMIAIISYNEFAPKIGLDLKGLDITRADSIWNFVLEAIHFFTGTTGILIWLASFVCASALTMFNAGVMLAIVAGNESPGRSGLKTLLSKSWFEYAVLQLVVSAGAVIAGAGLLWLIVVVFNLIGLAGSLLIGVFVIIVYPLFYALMSAASVIFAVPVPLREQYGFMRILLIKKNAIRLGTYYLIRIGGEAALAYVALLIARLFHLPELATGILVVAIVSLPYALVRTTGLLIKLDMLRIAPWFSEHFARYYLTRTKAAA
ncbi:MAG TPA: hypothetical protein VGN56_00630 [Candidatus Paceibacterota bacterium]|nr:hypothetical protein [Candidatus Paceibacterota bacterium]